MQLIVLTLKGCPIAAESPLKARAWLVADLQRKAGTVDEQDYCS